MDIAGMTNLSGYGSTSDAVHTVSNAGGQQATPVYKIPPVVWPFIFLIVGYLGLRMILKD